MRVIYMYDDLVLLLSITLLLLRLLLVKHSLHKGFNSRRD